MNHNQPQEIVLTPAFEHIFQTMLKDVLNQFDAASVFDCLPSDLDLRVQAMRAVQRWLAPLNIAAQCMTTKQAVEEFREVLNRITQELDRTATRGEQLLEDEGR